MRCVRTWSDISVEPFWRDVFTHGQMWVMGISDKMRSDVNAGHAFLIRWAQMQELGNPFWLRVKYKCWRPTWRVGLQPAWKRVGSVEFLWWEESRDSTDDDDPELMMIQMWWWSKFDDDTVMMIQQSWWSRSRDEEYLYNPFSGRMEAPSQLPGNLFQSQTDTQPRAESHSLRMFWRLGV